MPKRTKALSGAAQDAYFRRVLRSYEALPAEQRDQLVRQLRQEIAQLRLRIGAPEAEEPTEHVEEQPETPASVPNAPPAEPVATEPRMEAETPAPPSTAFDPYSPNVIVVLRKAGRDAVLSALDEIDSVDNLRLLAREQRLSVGEDLASAAEIRAAIVSAAERRVANRRAAAS